MNMNPYDPPRESESDAELHWVADRSRTRLAVVSLVWVFSAACLGIGIVLAVGGAVTMAAVIPLRGAIGWDVLGLLYAGLSIPLGCGFGMIGVLGFRDGWLEIRRNRRFH